MDFGILRGLSLVIGVCITLSGCTTAGPFVTNLSNDGGGKILVEKCMVKLDAFWGIISTENCTTHKISIQQPQASTGLDSHIPSTKGNMWIE